ncbi:hypothetical protein EJ110_NYTH21804 [Nymphaea thermarum]|nr:hypothetical protein EJ110_NYTH21804 [Nymphaea thermarum]
MVAMTHSLSGSIPPFVDANMIKRNANHPKRKEFLCYQRGGGGRRKIEGEHGVILRKDIHYHRLLHHHHHPFLIRIDSRANAFDPDAGSSGENGVGGDQDDIDWEKEMRERLKEIEEMKELERRAEELQAGEAEAVAAVAAEETEEEKRQRVRKELEKLAKEQAERRETAKLMFEIQIWLAMAYEAKNRHKDCIALYRELESKHPSLSIRRQAAGLRYILQAPKLKISEEEMVTIPLIGSSYDSYAGTWSDKYKDKSERKEITTNQLPSTRDYLADFFVWRPPIGWEKSRAFWAYVTVCLGLVGFCLLIQR